MATKTTRNPRLRVDARTDEPSTDRQRPSSAQLGGLSEHELAAAAMRDADPTQDLQEHMGPTAEPDDKRASQPGSVRGTTIPSGEAVNQDPDELGADFLRRAVQDDRPAEPAALEPASEERPEARVSETRMAEALASEFRDEGGLLVALPDRSRRDEYVSELCLQAVRRAHAAGARSHVDVHRAARAFLLHLARD